MLQTPKRICPSFALLSVSALVLLDGSLQSTKRRRARANEIKDSLLGSAQQSRLVVAWITHLLGELHLYCEAWQHFVAFVGSTK